jgi:hypothetical protein
MSCGCHPRTGRCFDPDEEGPSQADLERFDSPLIDCPECGTTVYDEAPLCPSCGHVMGDPASEPASGRAWKVAATAALLGVIGVAVAVAMF